MQYDKIILGAGLYGLYAAIFCARQGDRVLVLEYDDAPFKRATYINQARVHMGYHYPRSYSTAIKSAHYFDRFNRDFGYCVHSSFDQVYATSAHFSWTDGEQFRKFCRDAGIRCDDVAVSKYFKPGMCDGAFLTTEYTYDAFLLRDHLLAEIAELGELITMEYGVRLEGAEKRESSYLLRTAEHGTFETPFLLNATYASVNQVQALLGQEPFRIKYELCEIIICSVSPQLKNTGITVMDGPFFSIMPFGKTGYHSLTSVTFTQMCIRDSLQPGLLLSDRHRRGGGSPKGCVAAAPGGGPGFPPGARPAGQLLL